MKHVLQSVAALCLTLLVSLLASAQTPAPPPEDGKLRIICFGAHPDDCELQAGGVGALWAAQGHHVKFVSVTNGDIGHWREAGGPLALRRKREVEGASKILGTTVEVLDNHDGELMPTLENRKTIVRLIRDQDQRERLGDAARRLVLARYDWSAVAGALEEPLMRIALGQARGDRAHSLVSGAAPVEAGASGQMS